MKQIIVSRIFPQIHPRAGQQTHFVEKICNSIKQEYYLENPFLRLNDFEGAMSENEIWKWHESLESVSDIKHHTIRAGKHWKDGEQAVIKIWSGLPYRSKTITITPPLTLKVMDIEIKRQCDCEGCIENPSWWVDIQDAEPFMVNSEVWDELSKNDGLLSDDMVSWFGINKKFKGFSGQILLWNHDIKY